MRKLPSQKKQTSMVEQSCGAGHQTGARWLAPAESQRTSALSWKVLLWGPLRPWCSALLQQGAIGL